MEKKKAPLLWGFQLNTWKNRIRTFFRDFQLFLSNIWILFRQNFKEVMLFILLCSLFITTATFLLKNWMLELMMKVSGQTFIAPVNLKEVFLHPASILVMLVFAVIIMFLSLFEIAGLLHAFSMGQVGRDTNLTGMLRAGLRACRRALHPKNWLLIAFILVLFPLTQVLPLSNSTFKLILPGFVNQTIDYTRGLNVLYNAVYLGLLFLVTLYVFAINIFVLQDENFFGSCRRSRRLQKGRFFTTVLSMALLTLLLNVAINSVASVLIINVRELMGLFQRNAGIVTKSTEIGTYTYVLRQMLKSFLAPAVNNAALTVLFFRYVEESEGLPTLSRETFRTHKSSRTVTIVLLAFAALFAVNTGILIHKYAFLRESVQAPYVCAHRGDNVNAPENTMPAFELAVSENLSWIELDVHQTSDGIIVCNHDSSIGRVTGTDLAVHEHTYAELTSCEMGAWMPGNYEHTVVPTLKEVLTMAKENGLHVQVELKGHPDDVNFEENVLQVINETGMHDQVMIIGQDASRMQRIYALDPTVTKGYCMFIAIGHLEDIEYTDNITIEETYVTPELVHRMHEAGKKVFCWTVDLEDTVQYLVSCGVDVIGTDNPTMIAAALEKVDYSGGIKRAFYILMHTIATMER